MASAQIIPFCEAMAAEIRREILIAKLQWGDDDLEIRMIESSWGVTLDDRETLSMIRSVNGTAPSARRLGRGAWRKPPSPFRKRTCPTRPGLSIAWSALDRYSLWRAAGQTATRFLSRSRMAGTV
jgi:hypothetical protein